MSGVVPDPVASRGPAVGGDPGVVRAAAAAAPLVGADPVASRRFVAGGDPAASRGPDAGVVPDEGPPSAAERMAVVMARALRDGDVCIMGAVSAIPQAACRLAQLTHAPRLSFIVGGSGAVNPTGGVMASSCDQRLLGARSVLPLPDVVLLEGQGDRIDVFFAGGLQIDACGNCNLAAVGGLRQPKLRGPGSVGLPFLARAGRVVLYAEAHSPAVFVERVDFLSGPGFLDGGERWQEQHRRLRTGPVLVVTPLCTFDFAPDTRRMRVASLHQGVTLDEVRRATGFELGAVPQPVPVTPEIRAGELRALRAADPFGLLRVARRPRDTARTAERG